MNFKTALIGKTFNKLTVKSFDHQDSYRHNFWVCQCSCGSQTVASSRQLIGGRIKSCGCIRKFNQSAHWEGVGDISKTIWSKICLEAKKRDIPVALTIEQAWEVFQQQKGICKLTGRQLNFGQTKYDANKTASLDRIDSSKGYSVENVQWVHKDVNRMKQDFDEGYFIQLAQEITEYRAKSKAVEVLPCHGRNLAGASPVGSANEHSCPDTGD